MTRNHKFHGLSLSQICRPLTALAMFAFFLGFPMAPAESAVVTREVLKTFFETGDVPTQEQFGSLIDSLLHYSEDRDLLGLRNYSDGQAMLVAEGTILGPLLDYSPSTGLAPEWAGQSGFLGLAFTENAQTHYGYLQLRAGEPGGTDLYPIFVTYLVFEDLPNTDLLVTSVPEPSTLVLATVCGLFGLWKFARRRAV
jgi:hypothetical protein